MNDKELLSKRIENYYEHDRKLNPKFPKNMLMELTNSCNHNCVFCANSKMTRKKTFIDKRLTERILKEAYDLGTRKVGFYTTGEPLMNKKLEEYIKCAKNLGYEYIYITTNGALMDKKRIETIVEAGIDSIKFSINAGTKESYFAIHGRDDFEKVLENLKNLYEYRKSQNKKFKIFISSIVTRHTICEKELIYCKTKKYSDEIIFNNCKNQGGMMYEINDLLSINDKEKINTICPLPFNKIHISCEGYMTACCIDFQNYLAIADLNTTKLLDAWNSKEFIGLRNAHLNDKLERTLCFNCIKNNNDMVYPLKKNLASIYKKDEFKKDFEILSRIKNNINK